MCTPCMPVRVTAVGQHTRVAEHPWMPYAWDGPARMSPGCLSPASAQDACRLHQPRMSIACEQTACLLRASASVPALAPACLFGAQVISGHPAVLSYNVQQRLEPFWQYLGSLGVEVRWHGGPAGCRLCVTEPGFP